ncbi:hypothetical protein FOL46_008580 [Perkinsus olseni]|uniref:tRNA:m(4)X modification enzyme TRM13 n=1 Tax=Perkinsus olseni TaxID=32597 RepID=A0A7J6MWG9_PEROL|nr:hypothetical protein FOL46_008580 [Perkinsus olseni]
MGHSGRVYTPEGLKPYLEVIERCCSDDNLMEPTVACLSNDDARKAFDDITGAAGRQTWQNYGKLTVHLPQLESLVSIILKRFQPGEDTLLFELGAGKGLLGRMVSDMSGCRHLALDCRNITSGYDGEEVNEECKDDGSERSEECNDEREGPEEASSGAGKTIRVRADVTATDLRAVVDAQCEKMKEDGIKNPKVVLFIAKHLCGNGTDAAVEGIAPLLRPNAGGTDWTVRGAVLAPCCHPKAKLDAFACLESDLSTMDQLEGGSGHEWRKQVWDILMQLLYMSKLGGALKPSDCSSWSAITSSFTYSQLRRLGRRCRLFLESARGRKLVSEGAAGAVELVQYAPQNVTPDNLAIVYDAAGKYDMAWNPVFPGAVVIRVLMDQSSKKTVTLPKRLSEYILGMKSKDTEWQKLVKLAYPISISDLECSSPSGCVQIESAALVLAHDKSQVAPLISLLVKDPLVKRVVSMMYPITHLEGDGHVISPDLPPDQLPIRTCAAPNSLQLNKHICSDENCGKEGVVCTKLSPTKFVSVYSGVQFIDSIDPWPVDAKPTCCTFGWSIVPRTEWDPSLLRKTQTAKYAARVYELTTRFGVNISSDTRFYMICDKKKDRAELEEAIESRGGVLVDDLSDANLLVVEIPSQRHDAILRRTSEALQACEDGTTVVARLNVNGIRGHTLKKQDKDLRKLTVGAVRSTCVDIRINHLVTDKELEHLIQYGGLEGLDLERDADPDGCHGSVTVLSSSVVVVFSCII